MTDGQDEYARALEEIRNAVLDLQAAELQTFERALLRLSRALHAPALAAINDPLRAAADFDAFLKNSETTGSGTSMVGSHKLVWPGDPEKDFGVTLLLIDRFAADPRSYIQFCHTYFFSGSKLIAGIRTFVRQVLIPFERDYRAYVTEKTVPIRDKQPSVADQAAGKAAAGHPTSLQEIISRFIGARFGLLGVTVFLLALALLAGVPIAYTVFRSYEKVQASRAFRWMDTNAAAAGVVYVNFSKQKLVRWRDELSAGLAAIETVPQASELCSLVIRRKIDLLVAGPSDLPRHFDMLFNVPLVRVEQVMVSPFKAMAFGTGPAGGVVADGDHSRDPYVVTLKSELTNLPGGPGAFKVSGTRPSQTGTPVSEQKNEMEVVMNDVISARNLAGEITRSAKACKTIEKWGLCNLSDSCSN